MLSLLVKEIKILVWQLHKIGFYLKVVMILIWNYIQT